jgi:hypothetical protein
MKTRKAHAASAIAAALVLVGANSLTAAVIRLKVTSELANIRLKPSISSVIIRQIPQGEILEAIRQEGEWYLVKIEPDERGTASGYVHESLVLPMDETPRPERKSQIGETPPKRTAAPPARAEAAGQETQSTETIPPKTTAWSATIFAGGTYAAAADLNSGAQGFADFFETQSGVPADKAVSSVHLSFLLGGEIAISITPEVAVTVGADFFAASRQSLVSFVRDSGTDKFTTKPKFQAVPVRIGVAYKPIDILVLKAGFAYYVARCGYYYRYEHDTFWQEMQGEADATGLGLWGAVELEWPVADNFSLILEADGQYAQVGIFEGTNTYKDSESSTVVSTDGRLYSYDYIRGGKTIPSLLLIYSQKPAQAYIANAREAKIDFSGMALRAGIKVKF